MAERARSAGFRITGSPSIVKFPRNGLYNYEVDTDRGFPHPVREVIFFDGDSGEVRALPGFEFHLGNSVSDWLRALHMATDPLDYLPWRIFVCAFGVALAGLCGTGVVIWWKKRRGRQAAGGLARASAAIPKYSGSRTPAR